MHRTFETSPTLTAPSKFSVGTGTTDPVVGNTSIETLVQISGSDTKDVVAGYPSLNDGTMVATTRCVLLTTECNGSNISEFGLKNTDGTPLLFSRGTFTAISKTASIQIIIVEKDLIQI